MLPFDVGEEPEEEESVVLPSVPFVAILARFSPAAGPLRLAIPPPGPGIFKPGIGPPAPGAGEDREIPPRPIGPAEPTRPSAPLDIEGDRPGPLCPTSCGLPVEEEAEGVDGPPEED